MKLSPKSSFALQQYIKEEVKRQLGTPQQQSVEVSDAELSDDQQHRLEAVNYLKGAGYSRQQDQDSEREQAIGYLKSSGYHRPRQEQDSERDAQVAFLTMRKNRRR